MYGSQPQAVAGFQLPGYEPPNAVLLADQPESSDVSPKSYTIPPVVWPVLFLVIGYLGIMYLVEGE